MDVRIIKFFKNNDAESAMFAIMNVIKGVRMNEQTLFGRKTRCNGVYSLLQVFQLLLMCPCFVIRNPFNVIGSPLGGKHGCGKDVFYGFLNEARTDWRKLMYHINSQLWTRIRVRSDHKADCTCLMIDDTDFPKALFLGITDGVSQMLLDFAILGEKGKNGNYGMSAKELSNRYTTERGGDAALNKRICEYSMNKNWWQKISLQEGEIVHKKAL